MPDYVNSSLHELTTHGTKDFPAVIYGDSYRFYKDRFYYSHYHEEYEVITSVDGDIDILVNENTYHLSEGDLLFVNSNSIHCISHNSYKDSYVTAFVFHPSLIHTTGSTLIDKEMIDEIFHKPFEAIMLHNMELFKELNSLRRKQKAKARGYQLEILIFIYRTLCYIYKNLDTLHPKERLPGGNNRIRNALSFIYDNYNTEITLSDIAKQMELSEAEASRMFKRQTGKSPIEYLIDYRINMASHYLKSTDKSITEIAFLVGFSSSNYFTIAYKKINGITPKEFRKNSNNA